MELLIVTGLSGAGKSLAMNVLEDIGYFCIDNIPAGLMPRLVDFAQQGENMLQKVAVVLDVRGCRSAADVEAALDGLDRCGVNYRILFLDCSEEVLQRRYKETRRIHPLTSYEGVPTTRAIAMEREVLRPFSSGRILCWTPRFCRPHRTRSASAACFCRKKSRGWC